MDDNERVAFREDFSDKFVEKYDVRGVAAFGEGYKFMGIVSFPSGPFYFSSGPYYFPSGPFYFPSAFYVDYYNEKTMDWKTIVINN